MSQQGFVEPEFVVVSNSSRAIELLIELLIEGFELKFAHCSCPTGSMGKCHTGRSGMRVHFSERYVPNGGCPLCGGACRGVGSRRGLLVCCSPADAMVLAYERKRVCEPP